jgi:16S rRNA A1518/A1519 N6-dimethyltransferase RsmA/KsgA/DIM1 with predicted DNA glycosylase/AP lyase activity
MFGFPIKDIIIRKEITEEAKIVLKDNQGTCIVEASDQEPRTISNCPYNIGDKLIITFKQGTVPIQKYHLKE